MPIPHWHDIDQPAGVDNSSNLPTGYYEDLLVVKKLTVNIVRDKKKIIRLING